MRVVASEITAVGPRRVHLIVPRLVHRACNLL